MTVEASDRLWLAYHEGRVAGKKQNHLADGSAFSDLLRQRYESRLDPLTAAWVRKAHGLAVTGLLAARQGQLEGAEVSMQESRRMLTAFGEDEEAYCLILAILCAAEAFLDYRRHRFDAARSQVAHSNRADAFLIDQFGYCLLRLHQVQLVHNLMRIEIRDGHLVEARELGISVLCRLVIPGFDRSPILAVGELPGDLVAELVDQIAAEVALLDLRLLNMGEHVGNVRKPVKIVSSVVSSWNNPSESRLAPELVTSVGANWLMLQRISDQVISEEAWTELVTMVSRGAAHHRDLWLATVMWSLFLFTTSSLGFGRRLESLSHDIETDFDLRDEARATLLETLAVMRRPITS